MNMVWVSKHGRKVFHESFCPYLKKGENKYNFPLSEKQAVDQHYRECKFCRSVKGLAYKYRDMLPDVESSYDPIDNAVCFKTKVGFWKSVWMENSQEWLLFHLNQRHFNPKAPSKVLMRKSFHRQVDVPATTSLAKVTAYIKRHDGDKENYGDDYHDLPRNSKKQKKFYKQAKKRAQKKSVRNVIKLLDQLKTE